MIQKLKVECGANPLSKMTQMYRDISLSKNLMQEFNEHINSDSIEGVAFTTEILTDSHWE